MHIVVSWDIKAEQPQWKQIDDMMRDALTPHSWARPLSTFYVVRINSTSEREALKDRMIQVATGVKETVHFLISPAMVGGQYTGWLPKSMWPKLNERTK